MIVVITFFFTFNNSLDAKNFISIFPARIAGKTGRHNYTEWDQIFLKEGSFHPSLNPYKLSQNKKCRMDYSKNMCKSSLEILNRTIMIPTDPKHTKRYVEKMIRNIKKASLEVFQGSKIS